MKSTIIKPFVFSSALLALSAANAMALPSIDGTFNTTEWGNGYYAEGNGVLTPGSGAQAYDVEYLGLYVTDTTVYFGLQTGFDLANGRDYGSVHFNPGDFALDVNGDGAYDYAIDFEINGTSANFTLVDMTNADWFAPYYKQHAAATPFGRTEAIEVANPTYTGTELDSFAGIYSPFSDGGTGGTTSTPASYIDGKWSNTIEGSFDLSLFTNGLTAYTGGPMTIHWTMGCGNDYLNHESNQAPVPEPATMLLFGTGLVGLAGAARKKYQK